MKKILLSVFGLLLAVNVNAIAADKQMPAFGKPAYETQMAIGQKVYEQYCSGCHGLTGDGNGPAAKFLNPRPRNFVKAEYRFTSGPSGSLPTDEDILRTIQGGLHGTSMPSWALLPDTEKQALVIYIKSFAGNRFKTEDIPVTAISEDPYATDDAAGIEKGKNAYHGVAACYSCHAAYISGDAINEARKTYEMSDMTEFRTTLGDSESKENNDGFLIKPPDFKLDAIKSGDDVRNLYRIIANGINGTAMPSWKGILSEEDIWGMAHYVHSLSIQRPKILTDKTAGQRQREIAEFNEGIKQFNALMSQKAAEEAAKAQAESAAAPSSEGNGV